MKRRSRWALFLYAISQISLCHMPSSHLIDQCRQRTHAERRCCTASGGWGQVYINAAITRRTECASQDQRPKELCTRARSAHRNRARSCRKLSPDTTVQCCKSSVSSATSFQVAEI